MSTAYACGFYCLPSEGPDGCSESVMVSARQCRGNESGSSNTHLPRLEYPPYSDTSIGDAESLRKSSRRPPSFAKDGGWRMPVDRPPWRALQPTVAVGSVSETPRDQLSRAAGH